MSPYFPNIIKLSLRSQYYLLVVVVQDLYTQLANYLENDKINFIAPTMEESLFPFIWYWKLVVPMLKAAGIIKGNVKTDEDFSQPQSEFAKHHNVDLYRTGTFDVCRYVAFQNNIVVSGS